jgi:hypothetical protein
MRIALVDTTPKAAIYPVSLLKIGAWRKTLGDVCALYSDRLPAKDTADEIWLTTCFTFDIPHSLGMVREAKNRAPVVKVGGVAATLLPQYFEKEGAEVHRGLIPEAEAMAPDYSLLPTPPEYSITHTSRGCIRKCGFCMVHRLEPEFTEREWERDLAPGARKILFFDNNWLGKPMEHLQRDIDAIKRLAKQGRISSVDFNQGIDCRLMTEEIADMLKGVPLDPVRFAFDGMQEDGFYQRAVEMMAARGHKTFTSYVLYNFKDSPADFYYRIRESAILADKLGVTVQSFPMRYQPILEVDTSRKYVGDKWTAANRAGVMTVLNRLAKSGAIPSPHGGAVEYFEYWWGKNADEFERLLSFPDLHKLVQRRKGNLRQAIARGEVSS